MSRESMIVLGGMVAVVLVLVGVRVAYDDIMYLIDKPSAEELAQGEQAIDELEKATEAADPEDLVAAIAPCRAGRELNAACVTVSPNWRKAHNRHQLATEIWKSWAGICTSRHLADKPSGCFIRLRSDTGEALGGSSDEDASRIWLRE